MKTFNFDFENIGGVGKLYAIPMSSFKRIRKDYISGKNYLELVKREDIIDIPNICDEFSFSENSVSNDHGDSYELEINGIIPKISGDSTKLMEELERGYWLVLSQDNNGVVRLSGDPDLNILLKLSTQKHTGTKAVDRNGIDVTFSCTQPNPSICIDVDDISIL